MDRQIKQIKYISASDTETINLLLNQGWIFLNSFQETNENQQLGYVLLGREQITYESYPNLED